MNRAGSGQDALFTVLFEYRLFLPVFQHFQLSGDELQLFLDLGEEGLAGPGLLFVAESELNTLAQQLVGKAALTTLTGGAGSVFLFDIIRELITQGVDLGFQLGFVEQEELVY